LRSQWTRVTRKDEWAYVDAGQQLRTIAGKIGSTKVRRVSPSGVTNKHRRAQSKEGHGKSEGTKFKHNLSASRSTNDAVRGVNLVNLLVGDNAELVSTADGTSCDFAGQMREAVAEAVRLAANSVHVVATAPGIVDWPAKQINVGDDRCHSENAAHQRASLASPAETGGRVDSYNDVRGAHHWIPHDPSAALDSDAKIDLQITDSEHLDSESRGVKEQCKKDIEETVGSQSFQNQRLRNHRQATPTSTGSIQHRILQPDTIYRDDMSESGRHNAFLGAGAVSGVNGGRHVGGQTCSTDSIEDVADDIPPAYVWGSRVRGTRDFQPQLPLALSIGSGESIDIVNSLPTTPVVIAEDGNAPEELTLSIDVDNVNRNASKASLDLGISCTEASSDATT